MPTLVLFPKGDFGSPESLTQIAGAACGPICSYTKRQRVQATATAVLSFPHSWGVGEVSLTTGKFSDRPPRSGG